MPIRRGGVLTVSSTGSVTHWLGQLQAGDPAAVQPLWERYFPRLVRWARQKLRNAPRAAADEEDVALSAFDSFCRAAAQGRFPQLADRDDLWLLLMKVTERKAARQLREQSRLKRGGGKQPIRDSSGDAEESVLERVLSAEPSPEFAAQLAEECQGLLRRLGNAELQSVALWRMEGYTVEEIAERLGYAARSVKRKLRLIRGIWAEEGGP
jgi:DNA-directed RNA polymerase specialized sigma24 family protein